MSNRNGGPPPPNGMKRRHSGDAPVLKNYGSPAPPGPPQHGGQQPFDPRYHQPRGSPGPRGGRFDGRFAGRGPPPPPMRGRGPPQPHRPHIPGRGDMMGRGNMGRANLPPGRGSFGRGRGPPPPPPPPRAGPGRGQQRMGMPPPPPPPPGRGPVRPPPVHHAPPQHAPQQAAPGHFHSHPARVPPPPASRPGMPPPHASGHNLQHPGPHSHPVGAPPIGSHPHGHNLPPAGPTNNNFHPSHGAPAHSVQTATHVAPANKEAAAEPTYTKAQIDQSWTEHTAPNSVKYYYNSITKKSTYTKPECMLKTRTTTTAAVETEKPKQSAWTEYTDPSTGKKYYSDGVTTTWEKPDEMEATTSTKRAAVDVEEDEAPKRKKKKKVAESVDFNSKEEAVAAFKGLLLVKGVLPTTKWNEVVKMCSSDSRWEACEVLALGERKQALAEYQTKRANELRTLERQERMRAKEAFVQLLTDKLPSVPEFSATNSRLSDMRDALSKDDRFYAVEKEETRESLFIDFCEELRKREERKKRSKKRESKDAFFAFLKEHEEGGTLTFASTWESFVGSLDESQLKDPRFEVSNVMPESERELYFSDFVLELQAVEEERRSRIRDARRRAEKAQREAYRDALRRMAAEGKILPSSRWRNVEDIISSDATFGPLQAHERDAPREIFEDFIDEWEDVYRRDRSFLTKLVHSSPKQGVSVGPDTSYETFSKALLDEAAHSSEVYTETRRILNREDPVSSARLYFGELVSRERKNEYDSPARRPMTGGRRRVSAESSSEDEGEIIEDGEEVETPASKDSSRSFSH